VAFSPDGDTLVVTEKNTKAIDTFAVGDNGRVGPAVANTSNGTVPYGFAFDNRGRVYASEAASTAASSYPLSHDGIPTPISAKVPTASVPNGGNAPCWLVVTTNGKYAFTANAASDTISRFAIANSGNISLLGTTAALGKGVTDEALNSGSKFLYALMGGSGNIDAFAQTNGSLTAINGADALPTGDAGLAAW
jgi:6-phosphogluconolactonase (cycloisomerase 2 family)